MDGSKFRINILNTSFVISAEESEQKINSVVELYEKKIRQIESSNKVPDPMKKAILAALLVANDCVELKNTLTQMEDQVSSQLDVLMKLLDEIPS